MSEAERLLKLNEDANTILQTDLTGVDASQALSGYSQYLSGQFQQYTDYQRAAQDKMKENAGDPVKRDFWGYISQIYGQVLQSVKQQDQFVGLLADKLDGEQPAKSEFEPPKQTAQRRYNQTPAGQYNKPRLVGEPGPRHDAGSRF